MMMEILETQRLILRAWQNNDLRDYHEFASDEQIGMMAGFKPHESLLESQIMLNIFMIQNKSWAIYHKQDNKVIGYIGLHPDTKRSNRIRCLSIGYSLNRKYWGLGIMVEASQAVMAYVFDNLKLDLLTIYHYTDNDQSRRVIEKLGFRYDGTLRSSARLYNNMIKDEACYSMSKQEYLSRQ